MCVFSPLSAHKGQSTVISRAGIVYGFRGRIKVFLRKFGKREYGTSKSLSFRGDSENMGDAYGKTAKSENKLQ